MKDYGLGCLVLIILMMLVATLSAVLGVRPVRDSLIEGYYDDINGHRRKEAAARLCPDKRTALFAVLDADIATVQSRGGPMAYQLTAETDLSAGFVPSPSAFTFYSLYTSLILPDGSTRSETIRVRCDWLHCCIEKVLVIP